MLCTQLLCLRVCVITPPVCSYFTYCSYFLHEEFFVFFVFFSRCIPQASGWQVSNSAPCAEPQRLSAVLPPLYSAGLLWPGFTGTGRSHSQLSLQSLRLRESAGSLCKVNVCGLDSLDTQLEEKSYLSCCRVPGTVLSHGEPNQN